MKPVLGTKKIGDHQPMVISLAILLSLCLSCVFQASVYNTATTTPQLWKANLCKNPYYIPYCFLTSAIMTTLIFLSNYLFSINSL